MRAEPIQARGRATREKVIAAARELYDDPDIGRDRLDTNAVAAKAGVSIGTVYRYFEDRVDILNVIDPERDYPTADQIDRIVRWVEDGNSIHDAGATPREIITFLEKAL